MKQGENEMKQFGKNDPEFTAKALGERSEELDAATIAVEDQAEFEELKEFAQTLGSELKASASDEAIGDERLDGIRKSMTSGVDRKLIRFPAWLPALAACVAMACVVGIVVWTNTDNPFGDRRGVNVSTVDESIPPPPVPADRQVMENAGARQAPGNAGKIEAPLWARSDGVASLEIRQLELALNPSGPTFSSSNQTSTRWEDPPRDDDGTDAMMMVDFDESPARGKAEAPSTMAYIRKPVISEPESVTTGLTISYPPSPPDVNPLFRYEYGHPAPMEPANREGYNRIDENKFVSPLDSPLSTFSIDVDTASYANVRRFIENRQLPPPDAARIEELINYFAYDYPQPTDQRPFSVAVDSASAPWKEENRLVRIGLQGKIISQDERPAANLVFLVDVSGSMSAANKLPLAQKALSMLVEQMTDADRIAVVVYAGNSGLALPSTTANNKETIKHALDNLRAGGSTNGGSGITLAYEIAQRHFIEKGINRVILCTDGDFNVGVSDQGALTRLIEEKAKTGVYFSAVGFGQGNYRDDMMESLSNRGNGNYAYVDRESEARKVFVEDMLGTLLTIAKDVKIQVEFNPSRVAAYRLIGYENRALAAQDFNDDSKDAGEIGSGHSVTALYEIVPAGVGAVEPRVDALRYQSSSVSGKSPELLTVKLRYKLPDEDESSLIERAFTDPGSGIDAASEDFRFAASVAAFGMVLRDSEHAAGYSMDNVVELARKSVGSNQRGHRLDFVDLARKASEVLRIHRSRDVPMPMPMPTEE